MYIEGPIFQNVCLGKSIIGVFGVLRGRYMARYRLFVTIKLFGIKGLAEMLQSYRVFGVKREKGLFLNP